MYARRSLLCCTRSDVERVEADAAVLLGPDHPDADVIGLTLVGGKVLWPNSGLSGGSDGTGRVGKGKAAGVLVLLLKRCG